MCLQRGEGFVVSKHQEKPLIKGLRMIRVENRGAQGERKFAIPLQSMIAGKLEYRQALGG
jgi:hypothetical protein